MIPINKLKKEEKEKPVYIIIEKNLLLLKTICDTDSKRTITECKNNPDLQPKVLFANHDKQLTRYMLNTLYKPTKYKYRYIIQTKV